MPGILGDRLFAVFDEQSNGSIDYDEFIAGLAAFIRGNLDEKVFRVDIPFVAFCFSYETSPWFVTTLCYCLSQWDPWLVGTLLLFISVRP
jgi:hypothetical protein